MLVTLLSTLCHQLFISFHNKLKTNSRYLAHKVNRRCDDLIETLVKLEEDMFHDRKRKEYMKSPTDATRKCDGTERHKHGMQIPKGDGLQQIDGAFEQKL